MTPNTQPGPPCPQCHSIRTLLIADAPCWARCCNCGAPFGEKGNESCAKPKTNPTTK
jgi:hypothetical protein